MKLKITPTMKSHVRMWAQETFAELGHPKLGNQVSFLFRPMIHQVGLSEWDIHRDAATREQLYISNFKIILSSNLWPFLSVEEQIETVCHECCHLVDAVENKDLTNFHGDSWIALMQKIGFKGNPSVNLSDLNIPEEVLYDLSQKCSICFEPGHNSRTCKYKTTDVGEALNRAILTGMGKNAKY